MSDTPKDFGPASEVDVVQVPKDTPVREIEPFTLFAPNAGGPVASMDFRPHGTFAFKDSDKDHESTKDETEEADEPVEDGHGNFRHPSQTTPRHPSEPREKQPHDTDPAPVERRENTTSKETSTEEPQEAPDTTSSPQGSPFDT